jgi:hypothetical protein
MNETPLERVRGDSFLLTLRLTNPDGSPMDIEGGEVRYTIAGVTHEEAPPTLSGNTISIHIPYNLMTQEAGTYDYDVELTLDGVRRTLVLGKLTLVDDQTK